MKHVKFKTETEAVTFKKNQEKIGFLCSIVWYCDFYYKYCVTIDRR